MAPSSSTRKAAASTSSRPPADRRPRRVSGSVRRRRPSQIPNGNSGSLAQCPDCLVFARVGVSEARKRTGSIPLTQKKSFERRDSARTLLKSGRHGDGSHHAAAAVRDRYRAVAYSAIGRHLRVMCVLCLLLLGLGFLLGHHVANLHAKKIAHEFEQQSGGYSEADRRARSRGRHAPPVADGRPQPVDQSPFRCREARSGHRIAPAGDRLRRSPAELRWSPPASSRSRRTAEALHELEACRTGDVPLKPEVVTQMMTRIVDGQMDRLHRLLGKTVPAACPTVADLASLPLVPVSERARPRLMAATPAPATAVAPATSVAPAAEEVTFFPADSRLAFAPVPAAAPMPPTVSPSVRISDAVEVQPPLLRLPPPILSRRPRSRPAPAAEPTLAGRPADPRRLFRSAVRTGSARARERAQGSPVEPVLRPVPQGGVGRRSADRARG